MRNPDLIDELVEKLRSDKPDIPGLQSIPQRLKEIEEEISNLVDMQRTVRRGATVRRGNAAIKKRVMLIHILSTPSTDEFYKRKLIRRPGLCFA